VFVVWVCLLAPLVQVWALALVVVQILLILVEQPALMVPVKLALVVVVDP
jgi:hypothetical protein